jgi:hypothetical protein
MWVSTQQQNAISPSLPERRVWRKYTSSGLFAVNQKTCEGERAQAGYITHNVNSAAKKEVSAFVKDTLATEYSKIAAPSAHTSRVSIYRDVVVSIV